MRDFIAIIALSLGACASAPATFDRRFNPAELAAFTARDFALDTDAAERALRPTIKKHGAPHAYIFGYMSSVDEPAIHRLYGSGAVRSKTRLDSHTFWTIDGQGLTGNFSPIRTAHLVYDIDRLDTLTETLSAIGSVSRRGSVFTVFERKVDGQIVVTLHRTGDLAEKSALEILTFYDE